MLLVVLHNDQTSYAKSVPTAKLHRPPFDLETHGAGIIIQLRNVRQNLGIDFGTNSLRKVLGEFGILDLKWEGGLYT